jgi:hypothetical protein
MRSTRTRITSTVGIATGALLATLLVQTPAQAADPIVIPPGSILIESSVPDPAAPGAGVMQVWSSPADGIIVDNPGNALPTGTACTTTIPGVPGGICLGQPDQQSYGGQPPITVGNTVNGQTLYGDVPTAALQWIEDEAVEATLAMHDLQGENIARGYAQGNIRSYMAARIRLILDKKLYSQPLDPQEQLTYDSLMALLNARELERAKAVLAEYERWESDPCRYPVPPPPPGMKAVPNKAATTATCKAQSLLSESFNFLKNTPDIETFEAWAGYRNPGPLALLGNDGRFKRMSTDLAQGIATTAGLSAATLAAAASAAVVYLATSSTAASVASVLMGIGAQNIATATASGALAGVGAAGAATIVGTVLVFLVVTGISIWKLVVEAQVASTIAQRARNAGSNDDPLGIESAQSRYRPQDFVARGGPTSGDPALHTTADFDTQLMAIISELTMLDRTGTFQPDRRSGYDGVASAASDNKWLVGGQPRDSVAILAPSGIVDNDGNAISGHRIHFSKGWLMVSPFTKGAYQVAQPSVSVPYVDASGTPGRMSIVKRVVDIGGVPTIKREFMLAKVVDGKIVGSFSDTWTFQGPGGVLTTASVRFNPGLAPELSVLPTVDGVLRPGRPVTLRSHLSGPARGALGTYSWTIERLGSNGAVVETTTAGNLVGFQRTFTQPGPYRAKVRFVGTQGDTPLDVSGTVLFQLDSATPQLYSAALGEPRLRNDVTSDGTLSLDLRLMQDIPSDTFTVTSEWATSRTGQRTTSTYTVQCVPVGDGTCETGALVSPTAAPVNPQWSASPTYRLDDDEWFLPSVTVTVRNSSGAEVTRVLPISGEGRPSFANPVPFVEMPIGTFSRVRVTEVTPSTAYPERGLSAHPYLERMAAELPESIFPELVQDGGRWYLELRGVPTADDMGVHTFAFPVEQQPVGSGRVAIPAQVTLSVVSSTTPGYRAVLRGVPTAFVDRSYRAGWPQWYVQVAVRSDSATPDPFVGTLRCRMTRFGQVVVDQVCANNALFPWPALTDGDYALSVRIESSDQTFIATPYEASFNGTFLRTAFTRPAVAANALRQPVSVSVTDAKSGLPGGVVPAPFTDAGYRAYCAIDSAAEVDCSSGTVSVLRSPGSHRIALRVVAADDAVVRTSTTWTVATPAATLTVRKPAKKYRAGSTFPLVVTGLLPRESVTVRIGGKVLARVNATDTGKVSRRVTLPKKLTTKKYAVSVVGATASRTGTTKVSVLRRR